MKMKTQRIFLITGLMLLAAGLTLMSFRFQQQEPWKPEQLIEPADLAAILNDPKAEKPLVISIAPAAIIKGSVDIGPAEDKSNIEKLRKYLKDTPKDENIVIYCGCCPFNKCPNIRPAFSLLNQMQFKNHKLLNVAQNLKVNWIDHGYPVIE